jgi:phage tail-like protein
MRSVTAVHAVPGLDQGTIELRWTNPAADAFDGPENFVRVRVVRRDRTYPRDPADGMVVYDGPVVTGIRDRGLPPLVPQYYTVYAVDDAATPNHYADAGSQASSAGILDRGVASRLYRLLPGVHQQRDRLEPSELAALPPAVLAALAALPPPIRDEGPLQRFFDATLPVLDLARSTAEQLPDLQDPERVPPRYLPAMAAWLDWPLDQSLELHRRRNEVKAAPFLQRATGTAPQVRSLVTRYTGWETRIAELHQHLARANLVPQLNVFAIARDGSGWRGVDDAALALGFPPGTDQAVGSGGLPAVLAGSVPPVYPVPLRDGMELTVAADGRPPVTVRIGRGDFRSVGTAAAREVAGVLNATLSEVTARSFPVSPLDPPPPTENRIELRSHLTDATSSIAVVRSDASLVTLEGAPRGRLSSCPDTSVAALRRLRLVYETADPTEPLVSHRADRVLRGLPKPHGSVPGAVDDGRRAWGSLDSSVVSVDAVPLGRARCKTFRAGTWGASLPLPSTPGVPQADPVLVELTAPSPEGTLFAAWVESPGGTKGRIAWAVGRPRSPLPARLRGRRSGPFVISPRSHFVVQTSSGSLAGAEFTAADVAGFLNPAAATPAEVAAILGTRLPGVAVTVDPGDQTLAITSVAAGGDQRLAVDVDRSTAAAALGFEASNAAAAGDWGDTIDWGPVRPVPPVPPGMVADVAAIAEPGGGVLLTWSRFTGGRWEVEAARWTAGAWSAAAVPVAPAVTTDGSRAHRESCLARDGAGQTWVVWAREEPAPSTDERMLDSWTLRARVLPAGGALGMWGAELSLTTVPAVLPNRVTDRQPGTTIEAGPSETLRVYFQSDREGGPDLWELGVTTATQAVSALTRVTTGAQGDGWPAPLVTPEGERWLLFRSDRSVPFARVGTTPIEAADHRWVRQPEPPHWTPRSHSLRASDTGTIHRYAGSTTPVLRDAARIARSRRWDDLLAYTPDKADRPNLPPGADGIRPGDLQPTDLYTRGTIQLFISEVVPASSVAVSVVERLRSALTRYLPINVRLVVELAPAPFEEFVYTPAAELLEEYADVFPFIEVLGGPDELVTASLPTWEFLRATLAGHVSADPANPLTLRRRTYFPPPE